MAEPQPSAPSRALAAYPVPQRSGVVHVRARHTDRFTVVGNHLAQHRELSLTAIGLAVRIQSLPDGARIDIKTLAAHSAEGETRIAAALRELEAHGYLSRTRQRLPSGRIVTHTVSYDNPSAARTGGAASPGGRARAGGGGGSGGARRPRTRAGTGAGTGAGAGTSTARWALGRTVVPPATPTAPPERTPRPVPPGSPEHPSPSDPCHHTALALLAGLRQDDDRLLLSERDVRRLAPAVAGWLERDATPEAVRHALTANLPAEPLRDPAALLAHRLDALLPPPLPAGPPAPPSRSLPRPLQNCDGCDRAFRAPEPGRCRDCRTAGPDGDPDEGP